MRMREPFNGYKLSSGHFMFHVAYFLGSRISTSIVLTREERDEDAEGLSVLYQLNLAHILVPVFNFLIMYFEYKDAYVSAKILDTVSIFQY